MPYSPLLLAAITPFDWQRLLLSDQAPVGFLLEIAFRCLVTFTLTIAALRISGKRGVRQLSLFEFGLILVLGSAAGDATFYHDVPLLYVVVVFMVIIGLYALSNWIIDKHPRVERLIEGAPELIVVEGETDLPAFIKASLTVQEMFGQLRQYQVEHLGQVRRLYLEATGEISVYFFELEHERPGLPIWPKLYRQAAAATARARRLRLPRLRHGARAARPAPPPPPAPAAGSTMAGCRPAPRPAPPSAPRSLVPSATP